MYANKFHNCSISEVGEHRLEVTRDSPLKWGVTREELGCCRSTWWTLGPRRSTSRIWGASWILKAEGSTRICPKGGRPKILWGTRASGSIHHQVWTQSRGKIKPGKIFYSWHTADLRLQGEWVNRIGGKNSNNIKAVEMFNSDLTADQEFRSLRVKQITNRCEVHKSWKRPW